MTHGAARRRGSRSSSPRTCTTRGSCAEEYRRDAVIWRAGLDQDPVGSPERELAERDVAAAEHLAAVAAARVEALERIQDVRTDWLDRTRDVQERAAFAGDELERRGLDRDTADPVGEQQELFTIGNGEPAAVADADVAAGVVSDADAATSAAQTMRGLDPAQAPVRPRRGCTGGARGHGFRAGGHRAPDHRAPEHRAPDSVGATRPPPAPVGDPSWPWTTRSMPLANRCRRHRRSAPHRTGTPSCSPRPNGPPNGNGSSPPCSRCNPRPSMSRPHSHCTSTTLPATRRAAAQSTPPPSGPRTRPPSRTTSLTVSQATRQAEIIAEMRAELDARAGAVAGAPLPRAADPDDEDLDLGASRDDVDARTDVDQGQGLST